MFQHRLQQYLLNTPTQEDEKEWQNIKYGVEKQHNKLLGKKRKVRSKKGLRIWNEEIEYSVKEKQNDYKQWLQQNNEESKQI